MKTRQNENRADGQMKSGSSVVEVQLVFSNCMVVFHHSTRGVWHRQKIPPLCVSLGPSCADFIFPGNIPASSTRGIAGSHCSETWSTCYMLPSPNQPHRCPKLVCRVFLLRSGLHGKNSSPLTPIP
ncbi:unnamed protein product [Scytosiphon promiscuus]